MVVEVDALVDVEPGLVDPAQTGEVRELENPIDRQGEPRRRPLPEEERAEQQDGQREREHQDRLAGEPADCKGHAHRAHQHREREDEGRPQVVPEHEGPDDVPILAVRDDVVEQHREPEVHQQHPHEARQHREVLAPDILAGSEPRRVEQLAHFLIAVANQRHPGPDRDEERIDDRDHEDHELADRVLRGDPRLGAAHARVAGADGRVSSRQLPGQEPEKQDQHPEQRPPEVVDELPLEDLEQAPEASRAWVPSSARAAHSGIRTGSPSRSFAASGSPFSSNPAAPWPGRMSTR